MELKFFYINRGARVRVRVFTDQQLASHTRSNGAVMFTEEEWQAVRPLLEQIGTVAEDVFDGEVKA